MRQLDHLNSAAIIQFPNKQTNKQTQLHIEQSLHGNMVMDITLLLLLVHDYCSSEEKY